jgi:hypothetical protein
LHRPERSLDGFINCFVFVASPKGFDNIFNTDASSRLSEQFFNQNIVRHRDSLSVLIFQEPSLADKVFYNLLGGDTIRHIVNYGQQLLDIVGGSDKQRAIVDLFKAEFVQDFLGLGSGGTWLLDSSSEDEGINGYVLRFRESEGLLGLTGLSSFSEFFLSAIFDKVPLLLHIVWDKHFGHGDFSTSGSLFVRVFLGTGVGKLVAGLKFPLVGLVEILSLSLSEKSLLLLG